MGNAQGTQTPVHSLAAWPCGLVIRVERVALRLRLSPGFVLELPDHLPGPRLLQIEGWSHVSDRSMSS